MKPRVTLPCVSEVCDCGHAPEEKLPEVETEEVCEAGDEKNGSDGQQCPLETVQGGPDGMGVRVAHVGSVGPVAADGKWKIGR